MKKGILVLVAVVFVLAIFQLQPMKNVNAIYSPTTQAQPIAPGVWSGGTEVPVDLTTNPAPNWLELKSSGLKVTTPGKICHDFRGYSYHWVAEIRQLKDGKWVKLTTTGSWVPNEEGAYVVCAEAKSAGTYALFAYYNGPTEYFFPTAEPVT